LNPPTTYSEQELVSLLRERNEKAFAYLYDHYAGALFGIIHSIVTDRENAGDVLQNVLVNIWRKIDSYDPAKGRLFTWMLNVARNAAIDEIRSRAYRDSKMQVSIDEQPESNAVVAPVVNDTGLRRMLNKLKEEWRVLLDLSYFQGFTHEEISKILHLPLGTVKTRIRSALIQLRTMIEN
jgi:RNA polymerase sigma factor (sigma-70 family)